MLSSLFLLPTRRQAVTELTFASIVWGFGFIAAKWALEAMGPFWVTSLRFVLPVLFTLPFIYFNRGLRAQASGEQFWLAMVPGLLLGVTILLQIAALNYTTVTKNGFITVLYVVFVPLLEWPLLGNRAPRAHVFWVAVALVGTGLICQLETGEWNRGDLLTLLCAIAATLQILRLEVVRDRIQSSFVFSVYQAFWAGVFPVLLAVPFDPVFHWPLSARPLAGIFILAFGATLLGFLIQIRGQRVLTPAIVSMLFLLESPFAAFFAYLFLGELLTPMQWLGASLILGAAAATIHSHLSSHEAVI